MNKTMLSIVLGALFAIALFATPLVQASGEYAPLLQATGTGTAATTGATTAATTAATTGATTAATTGATTAATTAATTGATTAATTGATTGATTAATTAATRAATTGGTTAATATSAVGTLPNTSDNGTGSSMWLLIAALLVFMAGAFFFSMNRRPQR